MEANLRPFQGAFRLLSFLSLISKCPTVEGRRVPSFRFSGLQKTLSTIARVAEMSSSFARDR